MCKHQNITRVLAFMIVFEIHYNFLIALPIRQSICRSNDFFPFYKAKFARPKYRARLRGFARPSLPDWLRARNLSKPATDKELGGEITVIRNGKIVNIFA